MSDEPQAVPGPAIPPVLPVIPAGEMSSEELARLLMTSGMPGSEAPPNRGLRKKLIIAVLIAAVGLGASIMSCVGQSFSLRQARAQEDIAQQLKEIRASCVVPPKIEGTR